MCLAVDERERVVGVTGANAGTSPIVAAQANVPTSPAQGVIAES